MQQQASMATGGRAGGLPPALGGRAADDGGDQVFLTLTVADTLCGVPVLAVRDVLDGAGHHPHPAGAARGRGQPEPARAHRHRDRPAPPPRPAAAAPPMLPA